MECTPEEIEEKRKQALLKLSNHKKKNSIFTEVSCSASVSNNFQNVYDSKVKPSWKRTICPKGIPSSPYDKSQPLNSVKQCINKTSVTVTFYMVNDQRFAVNMSSFHGPSIEIFKTIPSRSYDAKTKIWNFSINYYNMLYSKLLLLQPDVIVTGLPKFVVNSFDMAKPDYSKIDLGKIDLKLQDALMPFQKEGVCFGIEKNGRCLIADDMGLGKTFQALAIAAYYREDWPVLIVTTSSTKNVWEETIHKFIPSISVMDTQYMVSTKDYIRDIKILITSHDMMTRALSKLVEKQFGIFIVDESHVLKNFKAKCTNAAIKLSKIARRVILLSGTPALSRPSELYSQLSLINHSFFGNFYEYSKRYCDAKTTKFGWDASGNSNLQELEFILHKHFMIRRTKDEVLDSLPQKMRQVVTLDVNLKHLNKEEQIQLNTLASKCNKLKIAAEKQGELLLFFAETSKIKIPSVCSFILKVLGENKKFIVFAHHQNMLDAIQIVLCQNSIKFIRIDGNTTSEQRKRFVNNFQDDDTYMCAILSITAANAGITLTAAKLVIFAELHWNPSILSQAESRAHRIGQENEVTVQYLLAPGTADDYIWPLLQNKQKTLNKAGLFRDSFEGTFVMKQDLNKKQDCIEKDRNLEKEDICDKPNSLLSESDCNERNTVNNCKQEANAEINLLNDDYDDVLSAVNLNISF